MLGYDEFVPPNIGTGGPPGFLVRPDGQFSFPLIGEVAVQTAASEAPEESLTLAEALSRFEKVYLLNALKKNNWKRGPTADSLGMDRRTLFRKMKDFNLEKE